MTSEREGVRGLVAKWRERGDDEIGDAYSGPWYECADELESALAAGEVEQRARELLADAYAAAGFPESASSDVRKGRINYGALERASLSAIASALSQQPEPKAEARGGVDVEAVEKVIGEMTDYLDQEVDPELDTIEKWRNALTEARNVR